MHCSCLCMHYNACNSLVCGEVRLVERKPFAAACTANSATSHTLCKSRNFLHQFHRYLGSAPAQLLCICSCSCSTELATSDSAHLDCLQSKQCANNVQTAVYRVVPIVAQRRSGDHVAYGHQTLCMHSVLKQSACTSLPSRATMIVFTHEQVVCSVCLV